MEMFEFLAARGDGGFPMAAAAAAAAEGKKKSAKMIDLGAEGFSHRLHLSFPRERQRRGAGCQRVTVLRL